MDIAKLTKKKNKVHFEKSRNEMVQIKGLLKCF